MVHERRASDGHRNEERDEEKMAPFVYLSSYNLRLFRPAAQPLT